MSRNYGCPIYKIRRTHDASFDLSRYLNQAPSFPQAEGAKPQRQDRLTGSTGLYMNYSIIFTEISFYPETSILLQII